jgi:hypothetical protein
MFEKLTNKLLWLDLWNCEKLEMIPEGISVLTSLTDLNLSGCKYMTSLPQGMGNLVSLKALRLSYCTNLERLPDGMLTERVRSKLVLLSLIGCEKLGFLESMTDETLRNASYSLGLDPNQCYFMDVKALGQPESRREEAFRLTTSFPSLRMSHIESFVHGDGIDVEEAIKRVASLMWWSGVSLGKLVVLY